MFRVWRQSLKALGGCQHFFEQNFAQNCLLKIQSHNNHDNVQFSRQLGRFSPRFALLRLAAKTQDGGLKAVSLLIKKMAPAEPGHIGRTKTISWPGSSKI